MSNLSTTTFDYVIVGSGAGGSVMAERLSRDLEVTVAVVEAGGSDRNLMHLVPKGVRFAMSNPKYTKSYRTESYGRDKVDMWRRGWIIGGSTTLNGMVWNRGAAPQYDAWEQAGIKGWSWQRFLEAFKALEDHELGGSDLRGSGGPVAISMASPREPISDTFVRTLGQHGIAFVDDVNSTADERVGYVASNIKRGTRVSAARAFLHRARRRRNLTLLTRTEAEKILFDGTTATGIQAVRGGEHVVLRARREVIVCAGGLESPMLLERSGIGHPDVLTAAGVPVVVASPRVGENMREHRSVLFQPRLRGRVGYNAEVNSVVKQGWAGFKYLFTRKGIISFGGYNILAIYKSDPESSHPDTQAVFTPLSVSDVTSGRPIVDKTSGAMFLLYPLFPTSRGSVHITGPGLTDPPRIVPNYLQSDHDRRITVAMVRKARAILATAPFADLVDTEVLPGNQLSPDADDDAILDYALNNGGIGYHSLGTCAAGPDAIDVVDERLRVRGTTNLRVVDASVFPAMPSGNNNGPTQALSWIAADLILEDAR